MGIEYLLVITVVAMIVLLCFRGDGLLSNIYRSQSPDANPNGYFAQVTRVVQGEKPDKINGGWCNGPTRTCECPAPAFGGADCS